MIASLITTIIVLLMLVVFLLLPRPPVDSVDKEKLLVDQGRLQQELSEAAEEVEYWRRLAASQEKLLAEEKLRNQQVVSQRKSSETRMGAITENLVPLLQGLPYDPKNLHHLGQPIDFIHFDYETPSITLIEVKSGNAKESKRQKLIKNCVKKGMVYYEKLQINEEGIKITREKNE